MRKPKWSTSSKHPLQKTTPSLITPLFLLLCSLLLCLLHLSVFLISTSTLTKPITPNQTVYEDDEDDVTLMKLASQVDPNPKPVKKIAFMFLTISPLPLAPLWEMYFARAPANSYNIYVHADPDAHYTPPFSGVFAGRVIPSKPTRRQTPSLAAAARRLLAHALIDDGSNAMFALLSPSCAPLHSFSFTRRFLLKSGRSFVEILGPDEPSAYWRWAVRGEDAMLPEVDLEDFRFGSQFWVVNRKHARVMACDAWLWSKFRQPCVRDYACFPEEQYFPTLLSIVDPSGCVPCTLTHVDWSNDDYEGHPRMYNASEVGRELILGLREVRPRYGDEVSEGPESSTGISSVEGDRESDGSNSSEHMRRRSDPFLFARKFSPESVDRLMSIANDVIFKD
ncbi:Core-2/I-branching beta-1-6-N-acetylglucosaminyltransferase family protein [Striga hermonthica]|uniref:Core-2/I-branching beta-1-6-N-acetylglucosaminyltransferase family protein n=1 Tax=Striga hermonthica TaxID=68872 RepID=A0A9N7NTU7_STRHE|nr:Core-2/I-branching beta-1-6-N-acetylglucosaminyltransferase family protein [Striga hermonthica]